MTMELNQQDNQLIVNGFLKSKNLKHNNFGNGDVIMGSVDVAFKDGEKHNVQRINVFASQTTRSGKENPSYKSIVKLEDDFVAGGKNADRVHVTGRLDYNIFQTKNGDLVKALRKNGAFFSRISRDDDKYTNQARAHVILTITNYEDQIKNGAPTGNKLVHNINVGFNNRINVIPKLTFNMKTLGNDIETIVDTFPKGSTIDAQINFGDYAVVQQSKQQAHGFGHHVQMSVATRFVHKAEIDYIEAQPISETAKRKQALSASQVSHAKELLEQRVQKASGQNNSKPVGATNPYPNSTKRPINDDEIPF